MYSLDSVRDLHTQIRHKINDKKKSIEVNIGSRYNDIIDASDIINDMKEMIKTFSENVKNVEIISNKLSKSEDLSVNTIHSLRKDINKQTQIKSSSSDLKLLIEAPERLWEYLESLQFMSTAVLYIQARNSYDNFVSDNNLSNSFKSAKIVHRSWEYVSRFYNIIQSKIRERLMVPNLEPEAYADAICSIYYLKNITLMESIDIFLSLRSDLLTTYLNKSTLSDKPENTMKYLLDYLEQLFLSLYYIQIIFLDENPLLMSILDKYKNINIDLLIKEDKQIIKDRTLEWLKQCPQNLPQNILNNFTSCHRLSEFEDIISKCILKFNNLENVSKDHNEDSLISIFINEINPWTFIFRDKFMSQIQTIILHKFNTINIEDKLENFIKDITSLQDTENDPDLNLNKFIWSYDSNINMEVRRNRVNGITSRMQSLIHHFDQKLLELMEDFSIIINNSNERNNNNIKLSDINIIKADMKNQCIEYIRNLAKYINEKINSLSKEPTELSINCILFLGRFILSLGSHSKQILTLIHLDSEEHHIRNILSPSSLKLHEELVKKSHDLNNLRNILIEPYYLAYTIWIKYLSDSLSTNLKAYLDRLLNYESNEIKNIRNNWKEVKIGENENDLEFIPFVPSPTIIDIIFNIVQNISKAGTFLIHQEILEYLVYVLSENVYSILNDFSEKLSNEHHKDIIIQSWFDSKFLCDLFGNRTVMSEYFQSLINNTRKESDKKYDDVEDMIEWRKRVEDLIKKFRDLLDPIELAFYSPHIAKNTKSAFGKYKALFGVLNLV